MTSLTNITIDDLSLCRPYTFLFKKQEVARYTVTSTLPEKVSNSISNLYKKTFFFTLYKLFSAPVI